MDAKKDPKSLLSLDLIPPPKASSPQDLEPSDSEEATGELEFFGDASRDLSEMEIQAIRLEERPSQVEIEALSYLGTWKSLVLAAASTFLGATLRPLIQEKISFDTPGTYISGTASVLLFALFIYALYASSGVKDKISTTDELKNLASMRTEE